VELDFDGGRLTLTRKRDAIVPSTVGPWPTRLQDVGRLAWHKLHIERRNVALSRLRCLPHANRACEGVDMAIQSHLHSNDAVRPTEVHAESAGEPLPKQMSVRPGRLEPAKWSGRVNWRWTLSASTLLSATASHDTDD
jgi:hypothetical protein